MTVLNSNKDIPNLQGHDFIPNYQQISGGDVAIDLNDPGKTMDWTMFTNMEKGFNKGAKRKDLNLEVKLCSVDRPRADLGLCTQV